MAEAHMAEAHEPHEMHGRQLRLVFTGLMLVLFMAALDSTIVATALPTIAADLGGLEHISWVATAYLLAQTVVTPLYGKLGDLYGRRVVLQVGLVVFLIGSALCGLSTSFVELVVFRAVQGLGGGGLVVSAQAAIGDVVSPRRRGRYQGLFGAVFGVATVVGPLVGGALTSLTTSVSWRFIFYINLPIGVVAFVVLAATFPSGGRRAAHHIDYLGTGALSVALAALVLMVSLGGTTYPWASAPIGILAAAFLVALVGFVVVEHRAAEPVLPMALFANQVFTAAGVVALLIGFAMFGAITFLPLYFQVVRGDSPTISGLQLLPLIGGLLIASIGSGQIVSRTGRYRVFPIVGTATMTAGLFLLSTLTAHISPGLTTVYMFVTGFGIGLVMQVLVVAVQNAVSYEQLGIATSGNTLFRNIGSAVGTAIVGTIFATALASRLRAAFPNAPASELNTSHASAATLSHLAPPVRAAFLSAYTGALDDAFRVAAFVSIAAFAASWLVRELPMRTTIAAEHPADVLAAPRPSDSLAESVRAISVLIGRRQARDQFARIVDEAGVDLPLAQCWVLVQLRRHPDSGPSELAARQAIPAASLDGTLDALSDAGLVSRDRHLITAPGTEMADHILGAARQRLRALLDSWALDEHPELAELVDQLAVELVPGEPAPLTGQHRAR